MCNFIKQPFQGRVSRIAYLGHLLFITVISAFVFYAFEHTITPLLISMGIVWAYAIAISIGRWHDLGHSGKVPAAIGIILFAAFAFMQWQQAPLLGGALMLIFTFLPGRPMANAYGESPITKGISTYFTKLFAHAEAQQGLTEEEEVLACHLPATFVAVEGPVNWVKRFLAQLPYKMDGRVNRFRYFWAGVVYGLAFTLFLSLTLGSAVTAAKTENVLLYLPTVLLAVLAVVFAYLAASITVRRLHDLGWSGYLAIPYFAFSGLPVEGIAEISPILTIGVLVGAFACFVLGLILLFKPGQIGANKYGGDPLLPVFLHKRANLLDEIANKYGDDMADALEAQLAFGQPSQSPAQEEVPEQLEEVAPVKKVAAKKAPAKKPAAKKTAPKKAAAKPAAKKKAPAKKTTKAKTTAKKKES
jgi:uncharacterized membrane protein YhaH (DUF805 family)